jgi:hypothetical protein
LLRWLKSCKNWSNTPVTPLIFKFKGILDGYFLPGEVVKIMKNLEAEGIYGFGDIELEQLDVNDSVQVNSFKKEWDLSRWPWERVSRSFGQAGTSEIDIKKMMANLLWQRYKWLKRGILAHEHRAIETLWGKIEAAVGHHPELTQPVKYDDYVSVLTSLIEEKKLFNYKDIGIYDMSSAYRWSTLPVN